MIRLFLRYHLRPAVRYYTRGVTPLTVIGALTIVGLFATAYGSYFTAVRRGLIPVDVSLHHLRALTLELVVGFLTTPVTFGRLTVAMLAPHCAGYLLAAAIVGAVGAAGGMHLGALLVLLTQGVFVALVTWLIPFRFLYSSKLFVLLVSGLILTAGFVLAVGAGAVRGAGLPVAYAAFVVLIPAILYPGASFKYEVSTVEDWAYPA